jgi:hypothetical protein
VQVITGKEVSDSRAVAFADLWNRGKLDMIVANQNDKLLIYKNHAQAYNNWIAFELSGTSGNKSAINAMVKLYWNKQVQVQAISGGIGFCSQNQRRVHFGMGKSASADSAVIIWPGGKNQILRGPEINQLHKIAEHD